MQMQVACMELQIGALYPPLRALLGAMRQPVVGVAAQSVVDMEGVDRMGLAGVVGQSPRCTPGRVQQGDRVAPAAAGHSQRAGRHVQIRPGIRPWCR